MKNLIGKRAELIVNRGGKDLHYSADPILAVSDTHITFTDKYLKMVSYRITDIVEIHEVENVKK